MAKKGINEFTYNINKKVLHASFSFINWQNAIIPRFEPDIETFRKVNPTPITAIQHTTHAVQSALL